MAEEKSGAERRYAKRGAEGSAEEERTEPPAEAGVEGDNAEGESPIERQKRARTEMRTRHEKERAALHNAFRQQHRDMASRHEDEFAEMGTQHAGEAGDAGGSRAA